MGGRAWGVGGSEAASRTVSGCQTPSPRGRPPPGAESPALLRAFKDARSEDVSGGPGPQAGGPWKPARERRPGVDPDSRPPARSETPQGLARAPPGPRLPGASSSPPQPRGPPLPSPSAPFIFPRLRLGFRWFLGDKNRLKQRRRAASTNRAGRAMCAWLPAPAGSPGRGGGPGSKQPGSRDAPQSVWGGHVRGLGEQPGRCLGFPPKSQRVGGDLPLSAPRPRGSGSPSRCRRGGRAPW